MSKGGYKIIDQGGMYYVSFAVVAWVDVLPGKITEIQYQKVYNIARKKKDQQFMGGVL